MNLKKILFAISAAAIMVLAVTLVPMVNSNENDVDDYIVNTVEVKDQFQSYLDSLNNKAEERTTYNEDDCSCSLNTSVYDIYGEQEFDDAPLSVTLNEDGVVSNYGNIDYNDDNMISDNGSIISNNGADDMDYSLIYDEEGNIYDIIITIDGEECSAREHYDPIDNCFVTLTVAAGAILSSVVKIVLFFCVIYIFVYVIQYIVEHIAYTDDGMVYFDDEIKVTDDISVGVTKGDFRAVSICGKDYKVCEKYQEKNKDKEGFLFVLITYKGAFIFPKDIGEDNAKKIMNLENKINKNGRYSVFTKHEEDAKRIASVRGDPGQPEIDSNNDAGLKMWHYHTNSRVTNAHAFFIKSV